MEGGGSDVKGVVEWWWWCGKGTVDDTKKDASDG